MLNFYKIAVLTCLLQRVRSIESENVSGLRPWLQYFIRLRQFDKSRDSVREVCITDWFSGLQPRRLDLGRRKMKGQAPYACKRQLMST